MNKFIITFFFFLTFISAQRRGLQTTLTNIIEDNEIITIAVSISNSTHQIFFNKYQLAYNLYQEDKNEEISFLINPQIDQNYTMKVELFKQDEKKPLFVTSKNISRYAKVRKSSNQDSIMMDVQLGGGSTNENQQYGVHLPVKYSLLLLHMQGSPSHDYRQLLKFSTRRQKGQVVYIPSIDMSQLHVPFSTYKPLKHLNETGPYNMTISLKVYPTSYFLFFYGFTHPDLMQNVNPVLSQMYTDQMMDLIKQILFTNNFYLVLSYFLLSFTQTFMQIFAFRSEVKVWKQAQKKGGLSIKSLYQYFVIELIVCLYLIDKDASKFYLFFSFLQLVLLIWKILRAVYVRFKSKFPFVEIGYKEWYHQKTQSVDTDAIHYTSYLTGALFFIFLVYKFYYLWIPFESWQTPSWRRFYSLSLEIAVGFIFVFGFVLMTPQLYINYRLKSVDHLPWKALIYRFISTIIDDIFVFMIDLPMMQRMFSFRDGIFSFIIDIIFIIYLIQRRMYKVDPDRKHYLSSDHNTVSKKED